MTERIRIIPCLMVPTQQCEPTCPNYPMAVKFRDALETKMQETYGIIPTEEEVLAELAKIDRLTPVLAASDQIANKCLISPVRKVGL